MDEQTYRELTAAVKESGIPLDMQKEIQGLLDEKYFSGSCTSATEQTWQQNTGGEGE